MVGIGAFALMLKGRKAAFTEGVRGASPGAGEAARSRADRRGKERGSTAPAGLERSEPPGTPRRLMRIAPSPRAQLASRRRGLGRDADCAHVSGSVHAFKLAAPQRQTMIVMTFTIELDIGLSFASAGPSDRTAIA